jgi:hypothetical protein
VVPVVPVVPIDAGKVVPIIQVDHPGPRLATAAVVPVVPIIDGGKLVPTCRVVPAVMNQTICGIGRSADTGGA